jgi:Ras GTPase-activating-like protein IQGAP2/3
MYGMMSEVTTIGPVQRRNLAAIANLITHVAEQDHMGLHDHFVRTPLKQFIQSEGPAFKDWVLDGESSSPVVAIR